jgi:hypothetical protein
LRQNNIGYLVKDSSRLVIAEADLFSAFNFVKTESLSFALAHGDELLARAELPHFGLCDLVGIPFIVDNIIIVLTAIEVFRFSVVAAVLSCVDGGLLFIEIKCNLLEEALGVGLPISTVGAHSCLLNFTVDRDIEKARRCDLIFCNSLHALRLAFASHS